MFGVLQRFFDYSEREISRQQPVVAQIAELEAEFEAQSADELTAKTASFRSRLQEGESLDDVLPEAFATVRESIKRSIGHRLFDVQMLGGIVLHGGQIAEMKTGEGKTYVAALSAYLNALSGKGVHIVTVNDYLSRRDTEWLGPVFHSLGLSVACLNNDAAYLFTPKEEVRESHHGSGEELATVPRNEAYSADITYGTNNEFGFDYLRDNMVVDLDDVVQGEHHYAIIDEVDNILIDEARTPLIISGQADATGDTFGPFTRLVPRLREDQDYTIDHKQRAVSITEVGIGKMEKWLGVGNLYEEGAFELVHHMEQALRAQALYQRGRDYVVMKDGSVIEHHDPNGEVVIVDEFTGRLMTGRRYSEGLHQAIEAKEGVKIQRESKTMATITFQNYFRMYGKLAGMTGTAATEADEFRKIYGLDVVEVPTNMPMVRQDEPDFVYRTEGGKFNAVADVIEEWHQNGAPVLAGTTSIETSEALSTLLKRRGVEHQVLNAKYHEQEAQIVAQAGRRGGVTIATNMAGRGTDIVLGGSPPDADEADAVRDAGGLHVVGTERHESRRIDNQLRGRSGRQGDFGFSRFYVSLEDELLKRAGSDRIAGIMDRLGMDDDTPIEHNLISKALEQAQTKIEAYNYDLRKHTVEYDDVLNTQRNTIYAERRKVLELEQITDQIQHMVHGEIEQIVTAHTAAPPEEWDLETLVESCRQLVNQPSSPPAADLAGLPPKAITDRLVAWADEVYAERAAAVTPDVMHRVERWVLLRTIDSLWTEHLTAMEDLRTGIGLRAVGQRNPLSEYKGEAYRMFQELTANIQRQTAQIIYRVQAAPESQPQPAQGMVTNRSEERAASKPQARSRQKQGGRKLGRNAPCWCGSGKKYKRCHGQ
jgi:preprotein translocase subunit SecA